MAGHPARLACVCVGAQFHCRYWCTTGRMSIITSSLRWQRVHKRGIHDTAGVALKMPMLMCLKGEWRKCTVMLMARIVDYINYLEIKIPFKIISCLSKFLWCQCFKLFQLLQFKRVLTIESTYLFFIYMILEITKTKNLFQARLSLFSHSSNRFFIKSTSQL